ncbi:MAG: hypothetical protein ACM3ME_10340 [Chloroflexota bacterium]|jgi:hypothetical protein|nr:hypothetical protein [Lentimicrobium sp.]
MDVNFDDFISTYPHETVENAYLTRELILSMFTQAEEQVDVQARIVGYTFGQGYKNTLYTIIPSQKSLKVGFNRGSLINDPECMLTGEGKVHKHVVIRDFYSQQDYLKYLLKEGFKLWLQQG